MINCCSLYGLIGRLEFLSSKTNVVLPIICPVNGSNAPLKSDDKIISPARVSVLSTVFTEIEPIPLSIFKSSKFNIVSVIVFFVLTTETSFVPKSIILIVSVTSLGALKGIKALPSDSIITSPKTLNPAGCVVSLIKSLQISIGVLDLITYE